MGDEQLYVVRYGTTEDDGPIELEPMLFDDARAIADMLLFDDNVQYTELEPW